MVMLIDWFVQVSPLPHWLHLSIIPVLHNLSSNNPLALDYGLQTITKMHGLSTIYSRLVSEMHMKCVNLYWQL
jgi:hypothetical protein